MSTKQLCKIPQILTFQYYPQQQLHASIDIENLTDQIVSFKIKTTAPTEYLVKPMEGQIYNREKAKIVFKRKKLSTQNYQAIQNGTKSLKQKFQFVITCKSKNAIGIQKIDEASYLMNVKFVLPNKIQQEASPIKKEKKLKTSQQRKQKDELLAVIEAQKNKLQELKLHRQNVQNKIVTMQSSSGINEGTLSNNQLSMQNIICLIILSLLLGMIV